MCRMKTDSLLHGIEISVVVAPMLIVSKPADH
jgi:hypothetical protein